MEHKRFRTQNLDWEGDHEVPVRYSGYDPKRDSVQGELMRRATREEQGCTEGHLTLDSEENKFSCQRTWGQAFQVESTVQEGVMEGSPRHVWGMMCHPFGWNPRLAVKELLKIKTGRWVESNCE